MSQNHSVVVCAMYKFVRLDNYQDIRQPLFEKMEELHVRGTLLLADEGINGTVAGSRQGIDGLLAWLALDDRLAGIVFKDSFVAEMPFLRTKVKLKKEIVTMGVEGIDPLNVVGTYIKPQDWSALIRDPEVVLIDTRNEYEYNIGTFEGAINPHTESFREFPEYIEKNLDPKKHKKVAMFCTGGIRCEKSTAYMKEQGFEEVYHLEGGILKYLEEMPKEDTSWQGECFVFDNRVSVDHDLNQGQYESCHGCRYPITAQDKQKEQFEEGVSCHHCHASLSEEQKTRFRHRHQQMQLAKAKGECHMGEDVKVTVEKNRLRKETFRQQQQQKNK